MCRVLFFFFNDTATTEIYTLSLHDALPISAGRNVVASRTATATTNSPPTPTERVSESGVVTRAANPTTTGSPDRKSTRLNSSHSQISYAAFCLQKKQPACSRHHLPH